MLGMARYTAVLSLELILNGTIKAGGANGTNQFYVIDTNITNPIGKYITL